MMNANKNSSPPANNRTSSGKMPCSINENRLEDIHEEAKQDNGGGGGDGSGTGDDGLAVRVDQNGDTSRSDDKTRSLAGGSVKPKKIQQQTPRYQKQPSPQRMTNRSLERQPSPSYWKNKDYGPNNYTNFGLNGQYGLAASKRRQLSGNSRMRQILIQNQRALNEIASGLVNPLSFGNENAARMTRGERATSTNQTFRSTSNSISSSPSTKLFRSNTQRTSRSVAFRSLNESMLVKCPFKQDQQRARSFTIMSVPCTASTTVPVHKEPRVSSSNSLSNSRFEFAQRAGGPNRNDSPSSSLFNEHSQNRPNIATVTNAFPTSRTNESPFNYQQVSPMLAVSSELTHGL